MKQVTKKLSFLALLVMALVMVLPNVGAKAEEEVTRPNFVVTDVKMTPDSAEVSSLYAYDIFVEATIEGEGLEYLTTDHYLKMYLNNSNGFEMKLYYNPTTQSFSANFDRMEVGGVGEYVVERCFFDFENNGYSIDIEWQNKGVVFTAVPDTTPPTVSDVYFEINGVRGTAATGTDTVVLCVELEDNAGQIRGWDNYAKIKMIGNYLSLGYNLEKDRFEYEIALDKLPSGSYGVDYIHFCDMSGNSADLYPETHEIIANVSLELTEGADEIEIEEVDGVVQGLEITDIVFSQDTITFTDDVTYIEVNIEASITGSIAGLLNPRYSIYFDLKDQDGNEYYTCGILEYNKETGKLSGKCGFDILPNGQYTLLSTLLRVLIYEEDWESWTGEPLGEVVCHDTGTLFTVENDFSDKDAPVITDFYIEKNGVEQTENDVKYFESDTIEFFVEFQNPDEEMYSVYMVVMDGDLERTIQFRQNGDGNWYIPGWALYVSGKCVITKIIATDKYLNEAVLEVGDRSFAKTFDLKVTDVMITPDVLLDNEGTNIVIKLQTEGSVEFVQDDFVELILVNEMSDTKYIYLYYDEATQSFTASTYCYNNLGSSYTVQSIIYKGYAIECTDTDTVFTVVSKVKDVYFEVNGERGTVATKSDVLTLCLDFADIFETDYDEWSESIADFIPIEGEYIDQIKLTYNADKHRLEGTINVEQLYSGKTYSLERIWGCDSELGIGLELSAEDLADVTIEIEASEEESTTEGETEAPIYSFLEGNYSSWYSEETGSTEEGGSDESSEGLYFRINAEFETFKELKINGVVVPEDQYIVMEGSIIIILKESYLQTLEQGQHTIAIVCEDGEAVGAFAIDEEIEAPSTEAPSTEESTTQTPSTEGGLNPNPAPPTGDAFYLFVVFGFMALAGIALLFCKRSNVR